MTFAHGQPASLVCMFLAFFSPRLLEFDGVIVYFTSGFFVKTVPSVLKNAVSNYQGRIKMKNQDGFAIEMYLECMLMVVSFVGEIMYCVDTCINVCGGVIDLIVYDARPFKDIKAG